MIESWDHKEANRIETQLSPQVLWRPPDPRFQMLLRVGGAIFHQRGSLWYNVGFCHRDPITSWAPLRLSCGWGHWDCCPPWELAHALRVPPRHSSSCWRSLWSYGEPQPPSVWGNVTFGRSKQDFTETSFRQMVDIRTFDHRVLTFNNLGVGVLLAFRDKQSSISQINCSLASCWKAVIAFYKFCPSSC